MFYQKEQFKSNSFYRTDSPNLKHVDLVHQINFGHILLMSGHIVILHVSLILFYYLKL